MGIHFTLKKVMEEIDFSGLYGVLAYASMHGIRFVDRIVELCERDMAFIWLTRGENRFIRKIPVGIMNLLINFQVFPQSGRSAVSNSHIIKGRDDLLSLLTKHKK